MLKLNAGLCVRSLSVESECNKCELVCPTTAISIGESNLPAINFSECVTCGACTAVCLSEALTLDEFDATNFFFDFVEDEENLLSCRKNVPCISALSIEHIISLAVLKKEIVFDMGYCGECDIAHTCHTQIIKNYEEATYLLEAMENEAVIKLENVCYVDESKDTNRRKIFFTAIKRVETPSQFHIVDATEVSFTSQKLMNEEACTACQMCYRVCPTGALVSDVKNSKIDFDPFLCIKCHICHDVCEPNAITLASSYNVKEFFEPKVQNLMSFNVRRCDECDMVFSTNSADRMCYRCKCEDEEARELWGITDDM